MQSVVCYLKPVEFGNLVSKFSKGMYRGVMQLFSEIFFHILDLYW